MAQSIALRCPHCEAGYLLPRALLGTLGARVNCPACAGAFDVDREGRVEPAIAPARAHEPVEAASTDERAVAREVLDELTARHGPALDQAALEGQLFGRHGPALMEAYDEYRRRAGARSGTPAFREELLRRWRVDLFPFAETRG